MFSRLINLDVIWIMLRTNYKRLDFRGTELLIVGIGTEAYSIKLWEFKHCAFFSFLLFLFFYTVCLQKQRIIDNLLWPPKKGFNWKIQALFMSLDFIFLSFTNFSFLFHNIDYSDFDFFFFLSFRPQLNNKQALWYKYMHLTLCNNFHNIPLTYFKSYKAFSDTVQPCVKDQTNKLLALSYYELLCYSNKIDKDV